MVGTIKQQLYISGVPKGMTFRVTALNLLPPDPPKEWRATLYTAAGVERKAPFTVDPSVNGGHMGEVKMYGAHAFPTNSLGARLEILWELVGTPTRSQSGGVEMDVAPDTVDHPADRVLGEDAPEPTEGESEPPVDPNDPAVWQTKLEDLTDESPARADEPVRTGRLIVETTKWGLIQRPDYVSVVYQVGSATPLRVVSSVAATIISMPKDALFVIGINTETQQIGINGVQETNIANTLTSYMIQGIFYIHEKAFGWVFGKFW
ncbi:hypothetical protein BYT27DRAFT_7148168 [Phlegmacium glaucopus]|nr:hypothetical protein BYT27DRAFT_7148168 [Phlegmacium glaucopus]